MMDIICNNLKRGGGVEAMGPGDLKMRSSMWVSIWVSERITVEILSICTLSELYRYTEGLQLYEIPPHVAS